jgi:hypothetical protein
MPGIARRTVATARNGTSSTALVPVWAGGVVPVDGDLLVAVCAQILQVDLTPPGGRGWLPLLDAPLDAGTTLRMWAWWKFAQSEQPGEIWSMPSATKSWACIAAYSGFCDTEAPVALGASGTHAAPAIAVPSNGWLITAAAGRHANTGTATAYQSSDLTDVELLDFGSNVSGSNDVSGIVCDTGRPLVAGPASRTFTPTQVESLRVALSISFGPEASAAGGTQVTTNPGPVWGSYA